MFKRILLSIIFSLFFGIGLVRAEIVPFDIISITAEASPDETVIVYGSFIVQSDSPDQAKSYIKLNISSLDNINTAVLYLDSLAPPDGPACPTDNVLIKTVTTSWNENTITWNNQPNGGANESRYNTAVFILSKLDIFNLI